MRTTAKKTREPVYEPVLKLPALPYEQVLTFRDSIAVHGVLVPTLMDDGGPVCEIIDGNYQMGMATNSARLPTRSRPRLPPLP
jgi:hypothetical protein